MRQLGRAWRAERKNRGIGQLVAGLPKHRSIDRAFLKNEIFLTKNGNLHDNIIRQLTQAGAATLIKQILEANVDLDARDRTGQSAVHYAASTGKGIFCF